MLKKFQKKVVYNLIIVVYFDQLLCAVHTLKLVELLFSAIFKVLGSEIRPLILKKV